MKPHIRFEFHHMGIPTLDKNGDETFSVSAGMCIADSPGKFFTRPSRVKSFRSAQMSRSTAI